MSIKVFGIKSCSTMKKAFTKLDDLGVDYEFHDYKKMSIEKAQVVDWIAKLGIDKVLNKRGTTWRKLTEEDKAKADTEVDYAINLLIENTSMIKRPIIEVVLNNNEALLCGYNEDEYNSTFK